MHESVDVVPVDPVTANLASLRKDKNYFAFIRIGNCKQVYPVSQKLSFVAQSRFIVAKKMPAVLHFLVTDVPKADVLV